MDISQPLPQSHQDRDDDRPGDYPSNSSCLVPILISILPLILGFFYFGQYLVRHNLTIINHSPFPGVG